MMGDLGRRGGDTREALAAGRLPPEAARAGTSPARGEALGRYTILAPVGRGGMGEVYAAYDPELDRRVAVKLMHPRGAVARLERAQARLLREAKAMAKLSHPNVVAVHDAGTFQGRVFIAMEFIDGGTLQDWLAERPRSRQEILAVFAQAAHGLGAAHAAGLVHRDFKPSNVMIAKDGSAHVTDFGLARSAADGADPEREGSTVPDLRITSTGDLLGTPRFMAPEQFTGGATDARTDQFSFCVALYRALYGSPPFDDVSLETLMEDVLAGRVEPAPPKSSVPERLRRILLRGLSRAPEARWASMSEVTAALARDPARVRRRWALTLGVLSLVALSTVSLVREARRPATLCLGGPSRLAGVWDAAAAAPAGKRDALRRAFLASGAPGAAAIGDRVAAILDGYVDAWLAMYREACAATNVRHDQPAAILDLRMTCLEERRTAVAALTDVLAHADRDIVANAIDAADALPSLSRCADLEQLRAPVEPPRDEATRRRVDDLRRRVAGARALNDAGKHADAMALARGLVDDARRVGYVPTLAEALALLDATYINGREASQSAAELEEAIWTSLASGHDDLAAESASSMAFRMGWVLDRREAYESSLKLASALIERRGPGNELQRAWLLQDQAIIELPRNPASALAMFQAALAIKEKVYPAGHPDTARTLTSIANALADLGRTSEALALAERAYAMSVQAYGPASIEVCYLLNNRGEYLITLGRAAEAIPILREAVRCLSDQIAPTHPELAYPLTALGRALAALGQPREAVGLLSRALEVRERTEPHATLVAETRFALAQALWAAGGDRARARALAAAARGAYASEPDAKHLTTVDAWLAARAPSPTRPRN